MNASDAIKALLAEQGRSKRSLSVNLGISSQAVDSRLTGKIRTDSLVQMAGLLGYEVVLRPKDGAGTQITLDE